jgi:hypothetical protein
VPKHAQLQSDSPDKVGEEAISMSPVNLFQIDKEGVSGVRSIYLGVLQPPIMDYMGMNSHVSMPI